MELDMHFVNGSLHASGRDLVGAFFFKGKYDLASGKCHWTKTYPGKHEVLYQGYQEGKSIWGAWEIAESFFGIALKGGFKIWPGETGAREGEELHEEVEVEIELVVPAMAPRLAR
ncbi:MAG: hypothetical protein EXR99_11385 [Gemmataceae bacterium]|nr:hypothetical protein [Gemmataceae bacterium]